LNSLFTRLLDNVTAVKDGKLLYLYFSAELGGFAVHENVWHRQKHYNSQKMADAIGVLNK